MFIEEVVSKIWGKVSLDYQEEYNKALLLDTGSLYNAVIRGIETGAKNIGVFTSSDFSITSLATSGCPHCNRGNKFSGCSMCDYSSPYTENLAKMNALKTRDPELYAKAVRYSFDYVRGKTPEPSIFELVTGYDCLNSEEFPDEVFKELFEDNDLFSRKPYKYTFETRASSINPDKIKKWKDKLGKRVKVEFGVEVGNEWIRNHWINKNITNDHIIDAVKTISNEGWESNANVLIGIPGFTEKQAIAVFKQSVVWLESLGVNEIVCSPLSAKNRTLQGFIKENLNGNSRLVDCGIVCGDNTGMPWIFTVIEAIYSVVSENPGIAKKIMLSNVNFPLYFDKVRQVNKHMSVNKAIEAIEKFGEDRDPGNLFEARKELHKDKYYNEYLEFIEAQESAGNIAETILNVGSEVAKTLWPESWENKVRALKEELKSYEDT